MNSPLVSVIIPTYNRAGVVCRAIESVLDQTYKNTETIVVDDGSIDDTKKRLAAYGNKINVLVQENAGPTIARNRGIARAQGDIVAFLDSDDYWLPTKLARQVKLLEAADQNVVCCLCNCKIRYNSGTETSSFEIADTMPRHAVGLWLNPAEVLTTRFVIFSQAVAIRREALERVGYFDENLPFFCEDHELALRLALAGPWVLIRDELAVCQDAGPESLGQRALREEVRLRSDLLYMRERISDVMAKHETRLRLRILARRELMGARRELLVARIMSSTLPGAAALARTLRFLERMRRAVFRRSFLYPRLRVDPLT
jgi:glycosyltransferase involved in cell wall biosynthesis